VVSTVSATTIVKKFTEIKLSKIYSNN